VQSSPRLDEDGKVRQKYGDVGEFFGITRKLARKDGDENVGIEDALHSSR
jgi:hypothetical protein